MKKPVIIVDAIQFSGFNFVKCKKFIGGKVDNTLKYPNIITPSAQTEEVVKGDWILKDRLGNLAIMKPKMFAACYEVIK